MTFAYCILTQFVIAMLWIRSHAQTSIAVVTTDKLQTRLKLLRDSPESLVHRLNSQHKGGKTEDIARAPAAAHQWVALDFDFRRKEYYVLDRLKSGILVIVDDPGVLNKSQVLFRGISPKVTALAYDWLRRTCYWTDPSYQAIFSLSIGHLQRDGVAAAPPPGKGKSVITSVIGTGLTEPCAIAVDPVRGHLFWADDGSLPSIEMATVDGHNRRVLARGLIRPVGMTLDYENNILYWIERLSGLSVINSCLINEVKCIPVRVSTVYQSELYDLDFHRGFLISSDLSENRLVIYDHVSGHTLRQNWYGLTYGVCVASLDRQPWGDISAPAASEAAPCCQPQNTSEVGLIFLAAPQTGIFAMEKTFTMNPTRAGLFPLVQESGVGSLAVDVRRHRLYYYSNQTQTIYRVDLPRDIRELGNSTRTVITASWVKSVTDLAVDWSSGNVYWLDSGYQRIMVSSDDGKFIRVVHYESITDPQGLVIDSKSRYMFWSDASVDSPRIERSDLDGRNRINLVTKHAFYDSPRAMAIDVRRNRLYWSDGPFISQATLNGNILESFRRDHASKSLLLSIDVMHDYVLWTDVTGGIRSADVDLDFPLPQNNLIRHFSYMVFSKLVYFHESRQSHVIDQCSIKYVEERTTPLRDTKHTLNDKSGGRQDNPRGGPGQKDYVMVESPICSHLCLNSRTGPLCACATGYWLKSNGSCLPGVTVNNYFIFCDAKTGRLFRQFVLLPDYYALPLADHTHAIDVAVDEGENKIYWIDSTRNMIHAAYINDTHHHIVLAAGSRFKMTKIVLETSFRLLYIVTSEGDIVALSLLTQKLVFHVTDSNWTVSDLAVDPDHRQLYMTATYQQPDSSSTVAMTTVGVILRSDLDGANLSQFLATQGRPQSITVYNRSIIWTDSDLPGIYSVALTNKICDITSGTDCKSVVTLAHLDRDPGPGDLVVLDDTVYFTDRWKQAIQRFQINGPGDVTSLGLPFMNEITGFSYFGSGKQKDTRPELPVCTATSTTKLVQPDCLLHYRGENHNLINSTMHVFAEEAVLHGLCVIPSQANGNIQGGRVSDYVLPGHNIFVTCDPGYLLSLSKLPSEFRRCVMGVWSSMDVCTSALNYAIQGNTNRGYVILLKSTTFVVPRDVTEVDVVCIGGGGGGYDACDRQLRKNRARAGTGETSRFGNYLSAYGGQGGTLHEGGRGGHGRSLFGGDGQLSSSCLGGGAAGETRSPRFCHLSHTSCLFCGAGGAMPACSVCPFRLGGCSGFGSKAGLEPGAADNYGGGATGTFGGGSGGGGGFSRKTVRVTPMEEIEVTIGKGGIPSAKPAGNGVVVVGWGARLEDMIEKTETGKQCKPFTYKLNDEDAVNFPDRCF